MRHLLVLGITLAMAASACGQTRQAPPPAVPAAAASSNVDALGDVKKEKAPMEQPLAEAHIPSPEEAVARLFTSKAPEEAWFSESFLAAVPIQKVQQILDQMKRDLGAFREVQKAGKSYSTLFERGTVPTEIRLDEKGRFAGLFFRPAVLHGVDLDQATAALRALPGKVSVLVMSDGKERAAVEADATLAVGSAFKLAVLAALKDQITAKKRAWKDVVELKKERKSLPSGLLQEWPEGSPLTISTLATLMIARSDNTATDALLSVVGRAAVEQYAPKSRPFLTTREAFVLKAPENEALLARFRAGDEAAQRKLLAEIAARPLPGVEAFAGSEPRAIDIEWRFSARELCTLVQKVADLPLMAVNPGVAMASDWDRVAFKGGSEAGVVNLTTLVEAKGKRHCVVATWNADKPVEEARFFGLYGQMLAALKADKGG